MREPNVKDVRFTSESLIVELSDGSSLAHPIKAFPRLAAGTATQRANWRPCGAGSGIHWPDLDEDVSIASLRK